MEFRSSGQQVFDFAASGEVRFRLLFARYRVPLGRALPFKSLVSDQGRSLQPVPALPVVRFLRISAIMADLAFSAGAAGESAAVAQVPARSRQDRRRAAVDVAAGCLAFVLTSRVAAAVGAMVQLLRNLGSSQRAFWLGLDFRCCLGQAPWWSHFRVRFPAPKAGL